MGIVSPYLKDQSGGTLDRNRGGVEVLRSPGGVAQVPVLIEATGEEIVTPGLSAALPML